jgi:hypothetical protein
VVLSQVKKATDEGENMAGGDYANCDSCGRGKIFYDANVDWEGFRERIGQIRITCSDCYDKGVRLKVANGNFDSINNYGIHCWTKDYPDTK